jgi:hypothetical protein
VTKSSSLVGVGQPAGPKAKSLHRLSHCAPKWDPLTVSLHAGKAMHRCQAEYIQGQEHQRSKVPACRRSARALRAVARSMTRPSVVMILPRFMNAQCPYSQGRDP